MTKLPVIELTLVTCKWGAQRAHVPYVPMHPTCPRTQIYFTDRRMKLKENEINKIKRKLFTEVFKGAEF